MGILIGLLGHPAELFAWLGEAPTTFALPALLELAQAPVDVIREHEAIFFRVATDSLSSSFCESSKLITAILDYDHGPLPLEQVAEFYLGKLDDLVGTFELVIATYIIADLMSEELVPFTEIPRIVELLMKSVDTVAGTAGFSDLVDDLPDDYVVALVEASVTAPSGRRRRRATTPTPSSSARAR
jgi:hypothetical protein